MSGKQRPLAAFRQQPVLAGARLAPHSIGVCIMPEEDITASPFGRLDALFGWWGLTNADNPSAVGESLAELQDLVIEVQKAHDEAQAEQWNCCLATHEELLNLVMQLVRSRDPRGVLLAEASIAKAVLDGATRQAEIWHRFAQRISTCCEGRSKESGTIAGSCGTTGSAKKKQVQHASAHTHASTDDRRVRA